MRTTNIEEVTVAPPTTSLQEDALSCLLTAIQGVDARRIVSEHLSTRQNLDRPVILAGIGKAAGSMASGAYAVLGGRIQHGALIVPNGVAVDPIPGVEVYRGGHPVPNDEGVRGAARIHRLAQELVEDDFLLCLISGGGSALMTLPPDGITLEQVRQTTDLLLRAGATIQEINCVRKHIDKLKGGRLALAAAPARVIALVLSDVIGDPLDVIASGPLAPDPTTFDMAVEVLKHHGLWDQVPTAVRNHMEQGLSGRAEESPKEGDPFFSAVEIHIVGNNRLAAEAAMSEAERRGYETQLLSTTLTGEARDAGRMLAIRAIEERRIRPRTPMCIVAAGETTVTVRGSGRGGRNQELALGAALELAGETGIVVGSVGTDGIDGPTDAAGALVDGTTADRARELGLDPFDVLARNDAYTLFQALGDLIITGPTGTNVMDIQVALIGTD